MRKRPDSEVVHNHKRKLLAADARLYGRLQYGKYSSNDQVLAPVTRASDAVVFYSLRTAILTENKPQSRAQRLPFETKTYRDRARPAD